jgi:hypothetical protein
MILSSIALKKSIEKYQKAKRENFTTGQALAAGFSASNETFNVIIAICYMSLELIALFFSIHIAFNCTEGGTERILHFILAVTFTLPYLLANLFFNPCAIKTIRFSQETPKTIYSDTSMVQ